jgi:hypothetical protein
VGGGVVPRTVFLLQKTPVGKESGAGVTKSSFVTTRINSIKGEHHSISINFFDPHRKELANCRDVVVSPVLPESALNMADKFFLATPTRSSRRPHSRFPSLTPYQPTDPHRTAIAVNQHFIIAIHVRIIPMLGFTCSL